MDRERRERVRFPPQPESVPAGRHFLTMTLLEWDLTGLVEAVALASSEVLTNAVVHARTAFEVEVRAAEHLVVSVHDGGPLWTRSAAGPSAGSVALPGWDVESGRGLALVEAVCDDWGVRRDVAGKTVWFSLAIPDGEPGAAAADR